MKFYEGKFNPKYREFHIMKKNIEYVVTKRKAIWKSIYGLPTSAITKKGEQEMQNPKKDEQKATKTKNDVSIKDGHVRGIEETIEEEAKTKDEKNDD